MQNLQYLIRILWMSSVYSKVEKNILRKIETQIVHFIRDSLLERNHEIDLSREIKLFYGQNLKCV